VFRQQIEDLEDSIAVLDPEWSPWRDGLDGLVDPREVRDGTQAIYGGDDRRQKLRDQLVSELLQEPEPDQEKPRAIVMMGGPGSGKSTVMQILDLCNGDFVRIDSDGLKEELVEYQVGLAAKDRLAADRVHRESSNLAKRTRNEAIASRRNFCFDGTLKRPDDALARIDRAQAQGYEVMIVGVTVPFEVGWQRVEARAEVTGRFVPYDMVKSAYENIDRNAEEILRAADVGYLYDASVKNDEEPILLASYRDGVEQGFVPGVESPSAEARVFNPADPTAAASHIEAVAEYNRGPDMKAPLFRLTYDTDWGEGKYSFTVEIPYGTADYLDDGTSNTGMGDIRLRYFHRLFAAEDPNDSVQTIVGSLDVFAPTGDADEGLGMGTWLIAPTVIFALPLSERWSVFPGPKVKFSTGKTLGRSSPFPPGKIPIPGRESEEYIFAFELEAYFTYMDPDGWWFYVDPIIEWDLLPEPDEDNYEATVKSQIGKMWGRWGLGAEGTFFVAGEKSQDYQLRAIFFYYF
jgi:predicted ABC-type ATPase